MTAATTIKTSLTPYIPANDRAIEMMLGKAMCAYANWQEAIKAKCDAATIAAQKSEYEATARCIGMLVREPLPTICVVIIESCKREFGI